MRNYFEVSMQTKYSRLVWNSILVMLKVHELTLK